LHHPTDIKINNNVDLKATDSKLNPIAKLNSIESGKIKRNENGMRNENAEMLTQFSGGGLFDRNNLKQAYLSRNSQ